MSTGPPTGSGKTSPKLYQDLLLFDPLKALPNANILTGITPPVGEGPQLAPPIGSCKHEYTTKIDQSITPPLDLRPDGTTKYKLAVLCKKCRIHLDVRIDYARSTNPCPNSDFPLHHFQRLPDEDETTPERIQYAWLCSAPQCQTHLQVIYKKPRVTDAERDLLINTERLKRRYEAILQEDPSREGIRVATPMEALSRLQKYVKDSLNPDHARRKFPANNKRFMEAFGVYGQDCRELLTGFGFKYADTEKEWHLPNPDQLGDRLQSSGSSHREFLEDVELELVACMFKVAAETGAINSLAEKGWSPADRNLERTLAAQGYQRHVSLRRSAANEELGYFASLGALPDFADSLIEFAYDRQTNCDPQNQAYYLECLQVLAESRGTEQLQFRVAMQQSQDLVSRRDLTAAYRYLNIPLSDAKNLSDDRIIELFQAAQPDLSVAAAEEARSALNKIGISRQSQKLVNASRQSVDTYEDALSWLGNGADKNTPDESLVAIYGVKVSDNRANEEIGRKAISTIASARKSDMLNSWLLTGRTDSYTMSLDEALAYFGITEKLEDVDQTIIPAIFENARDSRSGPQTEKAIAAIQKALENNMASSHAPETWPVGLISHGNTCYLNSLLQYYFSIKPIRDVVIDYDQYKLDMIAHPKKAERVGQRYVTALEIRGGQRFAEDLRGLFKRMIKEHGSAVKPEPELVCRAFLPPEHYALMASDTIDTSTTPPNGLEQAVEQKLPNGEEGKDSDASSATLQASDDTDQTMKGTDELPPTPPASPGQKPVDGEPKHAPPLPPRRHSTTKEDALKLAEQNAKDQQDVTEVHDNIMSRLRAGMTPKGKDESGEQVDALRDLYAIGLTETVVNMTKGTTKPSPQSTSAILCNVPTETTDIYSQLDTFFDPEPHGDEKGVEMYRSIQKLPPLLQVNMPRISYDKSKGGAYKSDKTVRLEDELYLDRYLDNPAVMPRRQRCWGWRKQLRTLKEEQKALSESGLQEVDGPTAVFETADYVQGLAAVTETLRETDVDGMDEDLDVDHDLCTALLSEAERQRLRLTELKDGIEALQKSLSGEFVDDETKTIKYRLAAVFIHRGNSSHGHYWAYIHDFSKSMWRKYNDEQVTEVTNIKDVLEATSWEQGTPTYAVYVADSDKDKIQPVCRQPEKPPTPEPLQVSQETTDIEMQDCGVRPQQEADTIDPRLIHEGEASWDATRTIPAGASW